MELSYEDVTKLLAIIDTAEGKDLDFTLGNTCISMTAWPTETTAAAEPIQARSGLKPSTPQQEVGVNTEFREVWAKQPGLYRPVKGIRIKMRVKENDVIAEIEDFHHKKHPVKAPASGIIAEICNDTGDFVEYGQSLVIINTAGKSEHETRQEPLLTGR